VVQDDYHAAALRCFVDAKLLAHSGQFVEAERQLAVGRRQIPASHRLQGEALLAEGEVLELAGKFEEASVVLREALALFEDRRVVPLAERARIALERLSERSPSGG
jgi:hypothetical protein